MLSIYGCDALEVPIALAEVEGAEPGRSLEVPIALTEVEGAEPGRSLELPVVLAEVEGAEPGGAPAAVVMSGGVQVMSSSDHGSIWSSS